MKKNLLICTGLILALLAVALLAAFYVYPKPQIANATHQPAPDFTLSAANGETFTLSSHRGHPIVLYFYRGYW